MSTHAVYILEDNTKSLKINGTSGSVAAYVSRSNADNFQIANYSSGAIQLIANSATGTIQLLMGAGPAEALRIDSAGNVGIGTLRLQKTSLI